MYCPPDYVDQEMSQGLSPGSWLNEATEIQGLVYLRAQGSNYSTRSAKEVRNDFKDFFISEHGKRSWQREIVQSTTCLFDEVDWSKQYLYQCLCFVPHDIKWFVWFMVMNNTKAIKFQLDTGRKLPWIQGVNWTFVRRSKDFLKTSSERPIHVQFTPCIQGLIFSKINLWTL